MLIFLDVLDICQDMVCVCSRLAIAIDAKTCFIHWVPCKMPPMVAEMDIQ